MKIALTGPDGMLGSDLIKVLSPRHEIIPLLYPKFNLVEADVAREMILGINPEFVIHAAAYTEVDNCESSFDYAFQVNAFGTETVALACKEAKAVMLYISTDYVFDGKKENPYTESDKPNPLNVYGKSKLAGEDYVSKLLKDYYIIRSSWLYGKMGKNFVKTILNLAKEKRELTVVNDQIGSPTYTLDLAKGMAEIIEKRIPFGIYNLTNQGYCSWYELAKKILEYAGLKDLEVKPVTSEEFHRPAVRPKNSRLDNSKIKKAGIQLRPWDEALKDYLSEENIIPL